MEAQAELDEIVQDVIDFVCQDKYWSSWKEARAVATAQFSVLADQHYDLGLRRMQQLQLWPTTSPQQQKVREMSAAKVVAEQAFNDARFIAARAVQVALSASVDESLEHCKASMKPLTRYALENGMGNLISEGGHEEYKEERSEMMDKEMVLWEKSKTRKMRKMKKMRLIWSICLYDMMK